MSSTLTQIESAASGFQKYLEELQPQIEKMPRYEAKEKSFELLAERIDFIKAVGHYLSETELHDVGLTKRLANILLYSDTLRHRLLYRRGEPDRFTLFLTRMCTNPFYRPFLSLVVWAGIIWLFYYLFVFVSPIAGWLVLGFLAWQLYLKGRDAWKVWEWADTWAKNYPPAELIRLEIESGFFDAEECASRLRELFSRGVYVHSLIFPLLKLAQSQSTCSETK